MSDQVSLRYTPLGQIHLTFGDVHLQPGLGAHRLTWNTKSAATWLDPEIPGDHVQALLTGEVLMEHAGYRWVATLRPLVLDLRGFTTSNDLSIELSDDQLLALERARGEDDIALRIKLRTTLLSSPADVHPVTDEELPVRIHRTRWTDLLDQSGAEVGIVVRLTMPLQDTAAVLARDDEAGSLTRATQRLAEARAQLRDHQWEQCVVTCRRVLEQIPRLAEIPSTKAVAAVTASSRTPELRWAAIYWDMWSLANASHHDDPNTAGLTWSRADAEAVLLATAGLLKRYTTSD